MMAIQGYEKYELAFCRIGDIEWTALDGPAISYQDLIYLSKDQNFYALSTDDEFIEAWDLRNPAASPKNTLVISHLPPWVHPTMDYHQSRLRRARCPDRYLVESSGELLMAVRHYNHNFDDNGNCKYNREIIIEDSISVSSIDFPGLAMNCIYFTCPDAEFLEDSHDLGIFNLEDNTITPIYHYDLKIQLPSPWIVPAHQ